MKHIIQIIIAVAVTMSCTSKKKYPYHSDFLKIEEIRPNLFTHTSYLRTEEYGDVPCNGLIYTNGKEAVVFDTPTDNQASAELITWIQNSQNKKIAAVIVTHFHQDCLGGLAEFHNNKIDSYAHDLTLGLAAKNNSVLPKNGFVGKLKLTIGNGKVISQYFGPGHTVDNVVGYIPGENALFGGCLIKSKNARKGNLEDANTIEWPKTVEKIKNDYPGLKVVVPGHGNHGGAELLDYSLELFNKK